MSYFAHRQTDTQTDSHTDRHTDRQTDSHTRVITILVATEACKEFANENELLSQT